MQRPRRQQGYSLVELMVAILIGLVILAGVIQVVLSSKTTFLRQEDMSYIQENARYALDVIGRDLQRAGYWDCAGANPELALVARTTAVAGPLLQADAVTGYSGAVAQLPAILQDRVRPLQDAAISDNDIPDTLVVRGLGGIGLPLASHAGQTLTLATTHDFEEGDYLAVIGEDCRRAAVVRAGPGTGGSAIDYADQVCGDTIKPALRTSIICDAGCNCVTPQTVSRLYASGSRVLPYIAHAYFVGESTALQGQPALKRLALRGGIGAGASGAVEEEVALGVEDIEVHYGIDLDDDGQPNRYLRAGEMTSADWARVLMARVTLMLRSAGGDPALAAVNGSNYVRQQVSSTYRLRNRL